MTAKLAIVTESGVEIDVPLNKLKPFAVLARNRRMARCCVAAISARGLIAAVWEVRFQPPPKKVLSRSGLLS